jgi:hypothetical protein
MDDQILDAAEHLAVVVLNLHFFKLAEPVTMEAGMVWPARLVVGEPGQPRD